MISCTKPDEATLAGFANIRYCVTEEPDLRRNMNCSLIKELRNGTPDFAARKILSEVTRVRLCLTLHMNCNTIPYISTLDSAMEQRLRIFEIKSRFVINKEEVDEANHQFRANSYFISTEFKELYAMQFMHILIEYLKKYYKEKE